MLLLLPLSCRDVGCACMMCLRCDRFQRGCRLHSSHEKRQPQQNKNTSLAGFKSLQFRCVKTLCRVNERPIRNRLIVDSAKHFISFKKRIKKCNDHLVFTLSFLPDRHRPGCLNSTAVTSKCAHTTLARAFILMILELNNDGFPYVLAHGLSVGSFKQSCPDTLIFFCKAFLDSQTRLSPHFN